MLTTPTLATDNRLPPRAGLGLKSEHFREVLQTRPDLGFFEVHAENYMVAGGPLHHFLGRIREQYPLSLHGVGLSIGGEGPLDVAHLQRLAALIERYQPQSFSEHLAWSSHGPMFLNDLLPLAYDEATLDRVCEHVDQVQSSLKRTLLLENPATYLAFEASTLDEPHFISEVIRRTGCGLLLDVNNVYVSCVNHCRDPQAYLDALPLQATGEIHLAGFAEDTDSLGERLLIDDHGAPIDNAVWQLYLKVLEQIGPVATLIERDNHIPPWEVLLAEARQADQLLNTAGVRS
ncbi:MULTISPECIES: MNIO family bufferin maturase [unclassified Pseudomonas]|uniref:MNIO family bufferin maturase n=1 Tax=unclassified Pseudomonas TaxID=196821 RepID=UPI0030DD0C7E